MGKIKPYLDTVFYIEKTEEKEYNEQSLVMLLFEFSNVYISECINYEFRS